MNLDHLKEGEFEEYFEQSAGIYTDSSHGVWGNHDHNINTMDNLYEE
jgi:hypothetical protein